MSVALTASRDSFLQDVQFISDNFQSHCLLPCVEPSLARKIEAIFKKAVEDSKENEICSFNYEEKMDALNQDVNKIARCIDITYLGQEEKEPLSSQGEDQVFYHEDGSLELKLVALASNLETVREKIHRVISKVSHLVIDLTGFNHYSNVNLRQLLEELVSLPLSSESYELFRASPEFIQQRKELASKLPNYWLRDYSLAAVESMQKCLDNGESIIRMQRRDYYKPLKEVPLYKGKITVKPSSKPVTAALTVIKALERLPNATFEGEYKRSKIPILGDSVQLKPPEGRIKVNYRTKQSYDSEGKPELSAS